MLSITAVEDVKLEKRLYIGKDLKRLVSLLEALKDSYTYIVEIDEFGNISVIPIHREYDEVDIEIVSWNYSNSEVSIDNPLGIK